VDISTDSDRENGEDECCSPPLVDISTDFGGDTNENGEDVGSPTGGGELEEVSGGSQIYVNYPPVLRVWSPGVWFGEREESSFLLI